MNIIKFKPLKPSEKIKIAHTNGVRTISEYAKYVHRNKHGLNTFPVYMNRAIAEQYEKEKKCID